jgi:hypothetical protein
LDFLFILQAKYIYPIDGNISFIFQLIRTSRGMMASRPLLIARFRFGNRPIQVPALTSFPKPENERSGKTGRSHFHFRKKVRNLGNGRGKKEVRTEAVPLPKPTYEKKISFPVFGNEVRNGLRPTFRSKWAACLLRYQTVLLADSGCRSEGGLGSFVL